MMCIRCGYCCIWFIVKKHNNLKDKPCPHLLLSDTIANCLIHDKPERYQGCQIFDCEDLECKELFSLWTDFYECRDAWRRSRSIPKEIHWENKMRESFEIVPQNQKID